MTTPGRSSENRWLFLLCSLVLLLLSWLVRPETVRSWVEEQIAVLRGDASSAAGSGLTTEALAAAGASTADLGRKVTIYLPSRARPGMLDAIEASVQMAETPKQLASEAIALLGAPPADSDRKPALPAGTRLQAMFLEGNRLIIDLSPEFLSARPASVADARVALYALVNTLTSLPFAEEVRILVGGEERTSYFDSFDLTAVYRFNPDVVTQAITTERPQ